VILEKQHSDSFQSPACEVEGLVSLSDAQEVKWISLIEIVIK